MNAEMDFKTLWNKEGADNIPATKELLKKAGDLKKRTRNKLVGLNLLLLATAVFCAYIGFNIDHIKTTTAIGILLISVAIVSYLIVYNQIMPLLFKSDIQADSHEYLNQLIRIKRKHEFLNKVMINVYFILLSSGLALYMLQFAERMIPFWAIFWYAITFAWIAISWFYLRPRGIRRKQKPLNEMIERLEEVNRQLDGLQ
jgi:hypothetical protein